ncbi:MAG: AI-2E family transporter [bacterium]
MKAREQGEHFFYTLLGLVALLCLAIFWPYAGVITVSAALAVALSPVFRWFDRRVTRGIRWLSSLLTVLAFALILGVPLVFLGTMIFAQAEGLFTALVHGGSPAWLDSLIPALKGLNIGDYVGEIASFLLGHAVSISASTLGLLFSLLLALLSLFFFLKDGRAFIEYLSVLSPLTEVQSRKIFDQLAASIDGVMRGYIIIGLVQGILAGVGLWLFGVPNALLWGFVAAFASMIPTIGTATISVPAILYLFAVGETVSAIGLAAWAVVVVGTVDNFLNPLIVGNRLALPPLAVLFAVLGGIALLGPVGILEGPIVVSLLHTLVVIYKEDFKPA